MQPGSGRRRTTKGQPSKGAPTGKGNFIMDGNNTTTDQTADRELTIEELEAVAGGNIVTKVVNAIADGINALLGRETVCTSKSCVTF
jgi:hypothetical protein